VKVTALANANHFSCWRSTPRERRNRTSSATTEASPHTSMSGRPARLSSETRLGACSSPSWAESSRARPRCGQDQAAPGPQVMAIDAADSQATGRHRRDGSRPSGNSSSAKVMSSPSPGAQAQLPSQLISPPPGNEPGAVRSA
jgi:hypothetical protein